MNELTLQLTVKVSKEQQVWKNQHNTTACLYYLLSALNDAAVRPHL